MSAPGGAAHSGRAAAIAAGEGYLWAPGHGLLERIKFPPMRTLDSSRTPRRGAQPAAPRTLAEVDLTAISAALAAASTPDLDKLALANNRQITKLEGDLSAAKQRIAELEQENRDLVGRLEQIVALAFGPFGTADPASATELRSAIQPRPAARPCHRASTGHDAGGDVQGAARKLLIAAAQHAPGRFTWRQLATLAGLKPSGGHFNTGRKQLLQCGYVDEADHLVRGLTLWCERLPTPAPEILHTLAAQDGRSMSADELAAALGKKPSDGHWNSGIAILRNNGLIEADPGVGAGRRYRLAVLLRS